MLGLHEHELDFEILDTGNTKTLVFVDSSQYIEEPERPLLEVTMPGYTKYFLTNVIANIVNTFNSSTLGINKVLSQTCLVDLPDGVWTFKYKICPYKYIYKIKTVMRVATLTNKLNELYQKVDLVQSDTKIDFLFSRIHILIEGAKAEAGKNPKKASEYYQLADKLIQAQLDKYCKNCK